MEWSGIEDQSTVIILTPELLKPTNPGNHSLIDAIGISVLFPTLRRDGGVKKRGRVWPNQSR
jgi:hypothetical protein